MCVKCLTHPRSALHSALTPHPPHGSLHSTWPWRRPRWIPESPPSQVGRARLLWPMTFTPQANLQFSAPSIQNSVAHAAATSAAASARHAAQPASMLSARTALTPWAQYMVVLVLQFIWRQRGSIPRGPGLRVSMNRRRSRHLQALRCIREASNSCPPAR